MEPRIVAFGMIWITTERHAVSGARDLDLASLPFGDSTKSVYAASTCKIVPHCERPIHSGRDRLT
jgi:hypothetical protein